MVGRHGLDDAFVVMHSGNVGHAQDLDTLVRAMTFLRDLERLQVMVIGFGARHADTAGSRRRLEVTGFASSATSPGRLSSRWPLRTCTRRARAGPLRVRRAEPPLRDPRGGRPVLVSADADSETVRLVEGPAAASSSRPDRPELVAGVVRDVVEGRLSLDGMGERGRAWVESEADREVAFGRYRRVVADVVASSSR